MLVKLIFILILFFRVRREMEVELVCSPCSPTTGSVSTVTSAAVDDKDTKWRTTLQFVNNGDRLRTCTDIKNYVYFGKLYTGGPEMVRARLLAEI